MQIKYILFDLDGTLFDTQKFHAAAEAELIRRNGGNITPEELTAKYAGRPTETVFREVLNCNEEEASALTAEKWDMILSGADHAPALFNLPRFFSVLTRLGIKFGIGTASPQIWARNLILAHNLSKYFNEANVVGGDMVKNGKPDPEIWTTLARRLDHRYTPSACLVVEDGIAGVKAAADAGMNSALILPKTFPKAKNIHKAEDVLWMVRTE